MPVPSPRASPRSSRLNKFDYLSLALLCLGLIAVCLRFSHRQLLWPDEEYTREFVLDPSILHMWRAWRAGADGGGVFYYTFCRWWIEVFGFSALTIRLFSAFGIIVALIVTWVAARRYFSLFPVAFGASLIFLTTSCILWQDVNGRFYGMFLAEAALACWLFLRTAEQEHPGKIDLVLLGVTQALLIGTHILGMVYGAALLVATVVFDRFCHRWRPRLYLAGLAGWIMLPISYRAIVNTALVGRTGFWTVKPPLHSLWDAQLAYNDLVIAWVICLLVFIALAGLLVNRRDPYGPLAARLRANPWLFMLGGLALVQLVLFAKSRVGISIYADRYLLPLQVGDVFWLAALFTYAWRLSPMLWHWRRFAALAALCAVLLSVHYGLSNPSHGQFYPSPGMPQRLEEMLPPNHQIVTTSLAVFSVMRSYDPAHHYIFPIDWKYDAEPAHASAEQADELFMENWRHAGFADGDILDCSAALNTAPDFTVLVDPARLDWLKERILNNPAFQAQQVGSFNEWVPVTVWNVHRLSAPPPCS
jgi:hypothetical protein